MKNSKNPEPGLENAALVERAGPRPRQITRRQFVSLASAAALAPLLPGCGRGSSNPGPADILVGPQLAEGFEMGVNSSGNQNSWVTVDPQGFVVCTYPGDQTWGAVFLFVRGDAPNVKRTLNYSSYKNLSIDLKKISGGNDLEISTKSETDSDDGSEPKFKVNLTEEWQTFRIPLVEFVKEPDFPPTRLSHLHVVCLLTFPENRAETIHFRNVRYTQ